MNREGHEDTRFFVGVEIENLPTKGLLTLFVVGLQDPQLILSKAAEHNVKSIYFGANQSFELKKGCEDWTAWETMIMDVLHHKAKYWCALDLDITELEGLTDTALVEENRFVTVVSAKIPYICQLGYNSVLKIDDKDFDATNPGVWVHRIHDLMDKESFTHWYQYLDDEPLS